MAIYPLCKTNLLRKIRFGVTNKKCISLCPKKKGDKRILISYITDPFTSIDHEKQFRSHTNQWECYFFADYWLNRGYSVDIIDWDDTAFTPKREYDIFIDIHSNMERLAPLLNEDCKKILHITGAHWLFQNTAEYSRLLDVQRRRGAALKPRRLASPTFGIENADAATVLGNDFTKSTFSYAGKPLYKLPLSSLVEYNFNSQKNFHLCRNNFLWLGSSGMVHKGLDLVLEAFAEMPEYHLTICGPVEGEDDFINCYYKELFQLKNITLYGWIDVGSPKFFEITSNCIGLVYPSSSEGQAGSVITSLHAGLIPIISYQSGVDIDAFGIVLEKCSIREIGDQIRYISGLPTETLAAMSKGAWDYARTTHTREMFASAYEKVIHEIITSDGD